MKFFFALLALFSVAVNYSNGLSCYECSNARTNEECLRNGALRACVEAEAICEDQIRHEDYGRIIIIEKRCKQSLACDNNVIQNERPADPVQCTGGGSQNSVCRCCCTSDGCNKNLQTCWDANQQPPRRSCSEFPPPPANGDMQCHGNKEPGTYCDFKCHQNYYILGPQRITCLDDGKYDRDPPVCQLKTCLPESFTLGNGTVQCTDGNNLRSRCSFKCNEDFGLVGNPYTECRDNERNATYGFWDNRPPYCKPLTCPAVGPLRNGMFSCTRDFKFRSVCTWRCNGQFQLFPPGFTTTVCLESGNWDRPWPCCTLPCLPFAVVDLMVILDSSSSVQQENWDQMVQFTVNLFRAFALQPDAAQFSVFRYNRVVDIATAIHFNDYPDDKEAFLDALRRIPYDGSGTNTGRAITYAARRGLAKENGNREAAPDIVILITDGNSQDRVQIAARVLNATGADVKVIPVAPPGANGTDFNFNLDDMIAIANGKEENVIRDALERGFAALSEDFADELAQDLCPDPCSNPFHDGEEKTPDRLIEYLRKK